MQAQIEMYTTQQNGQAVRVIVFGGILNGKMAAYEGTPAWQEAFQLARQLGVEITRAYGYKGSLAQ